MDSGVVIPTRHGPVLKSNNKKIIGVANYKIPYIFVKFYFMNIEFDFNIKY